MKADKEYWKCQITSVRFAETKKIFHTLIMFMFMPNRKHTILGGDNTTDCN